MHRIFLLHSLITSAIAVQMVANITSTNLYSSEPRCIGTSTYDFTPLETVFVTVDGSYIHTGFANDTGLTDIYYTPPPPCSTVVVVPTPTTIVTVITILPNTTSSSGSVVTVTTSSMVTTCKPRSVSSTSTKSIRSGPYLNTTSTSTISSPGENCSIVLSEFRTIITQVSTTTRGGNPGNPHPHPNVPPPAEETTSVPQQDPAPGIQVSTVTEVYGSFATPETKVTVTVTKKTPVLSTTTNNPGGGTNSGPTFPQNNQPITIKSTSPRPNAPGDTAGSTNVGDGTNPGGLIIAPTNSDGNNNGARPVAPTSQGQTTGATNPTGNANGGGNNNNNAASSAKDSPPTTVTGGSGLGSIINSAFNSPFTAVIGASTSLGTASATMTLLGGVPVQVDSSSVYIGGSYVALPTGTSAAIVTIAGETFTVLPTAVIVGTNTLDVIRSQSVSYTAIQAVTQAASTVTRSGVIITIQPTAAVVSGTTYLIGLNAPSTTAVVNGQTLTFDGDGVVFGASTYTPALITAPAYVVTTIGSLTISIDQSQAIISGTTYSIGAGASNHKTTAVIDGTTITFGPNGIALPSTTIAPTSIQLTGMVPSTTSASAATRVLSDPSTTTSSNIGATSRSPSSLSNIFCFVVMTLAFAILPISLFL